LNLNQNKTMKKYLLTLALTAAAILSASSLRAQDTNTPAPAPAPAATNVVATVTMQPLPSSELSMEQRITSMEAYVANAAPAAPLNLNDAKVLVSNAGQAIRIRTEEKGYSTV
jgi:hypothetical protein